MNNQIGSKQVTRQNILIFSMEEDGPIKGTIQKFSKIQTRNYFKKIQMNGNKKYQECLCK